MNHNNASGKGDVDCDLEQILLLVLSWNPSPHETEQADHSDQGDNLAFVLLLVVLLLPSVLLVVGGGLVGLRNGEGECGSSSSFPPPPPPPPIPPPPCPT